jgi:CBS domain-containing protein
MDSSPEVYSELSFDDSYSKLSATTSKGQSMVVLDAKLPAIELLKELGEHHILGAPIVEESEDVGTYPYSSCSNGKVKRLLGMVDMIDICAYTLTVVDKLESIAQGGEDRIDWQFVFNNCLQFKTAKDLINFSKCNYMYPLTPKSTLREILDTLSTKKVHRVPIVEKGQLVRVVTQSEVLRFVSQHLDALGSVLDVSLHLSGVAAKRIPLIYVSESSSTLEALKKIVGGKISAVPILNKEMKLISTFSARDVSEVLKIQPKTELLQPVSTTIAEIHGGQVTPVDISKSKNVVVKVLPISYPCLLRLITIVRFDFVSRKWYRIVYIAFISWMKRCMP